MIALMILSVLLYSRCFYLLISLRHRRINFKNVSAGRIPSFETIGQIQTELTDEYTQHRFAIGSMITAAPLLGLLGTVMGMIGAFESLATNGNQRSMEGLAKGISEVLIDTESGLAVAIPALLLLYYAHRQLQKGTEELARAEVSLREAN